MKALKLLLSISLSLSLNVFSRGENAETVVSSQETMNIQKLAKNAEIADFTPSNQCDNCPKTDVDPAVQKSVENVKVLKQKAEGNQ